MLTVKQLLNIFKITFIIIGTILGAGFASGKEIITFFAKFGNLGIIGFFISCVLLFLACLSILYLIYSFKSQNYNNFIYYLFGKKLGKIISYLNAFFLFSVFFIMIAGGGATINVFFPKLNYKLANLIFTIIIFISLSFGTNGIVKINEIISPILIIGIIFFNIYLNFFYSVTTFSMIDVTYSSILYASYNVITILSLLFSIRHLVLNKKVCFYSAGLSSFIIFIIGFFMLIPLINNYSSVYNFDLPIIFLIEEKSFILKYIYTFILFLAIFTTAVGNGFAFIDFVQHNIYKNFKFLTFFVCSIALLFSFIGFSNLVEKIYHLFGYLGVFQIVIIFLSFISIFKFYKKSF